MADTDTTDMHDLVVPEMGESISEAVIGRWLVEVGEYVRADDSIVELETDKITAELPAPMDGVLTEQLVESGATVEVGDVVGRLDASAEAPASDDEGSSREATDGDGSSSAASASRADESGDADTGERKASTSSSESEAPAKSASRAEPDPEELARATPSRRRDMRLGRVDSPGAARQEDGPASRESTDEPDTGPDERVVPMSRLRKRIAERLVQAQHESASLTTFNEVDMSAVMAMRSEHKEAFLDKHGVKLGFMSFFAKACVSACQLFPGLNAEIRGDDIVYKERYDFGVAVSTERGLVVPVLRGVDTMSFAEIERTINELASKARSGKLALDDLLDGTFTITNGGIFGSMLSTPLLNYPQTGILGMHNIVPRPVAVGDTVEVRPVMYIALTYDHRVVDGREAVQFLVAVKERIEKPDRLMFDL